MIDRHVARYGRAIDLAGRTGGVWWDVGCGTGYGTLMMPADDRHGFDKDSGAINRACGAEPADVPAHFAHTDITKAGWPGGVPDADVVLCIETLEHLRPGDQDQVVGTIRGRMKEGGVLVVCCPIGSGGPSKTNPWHLHEPTGRELRGLIAKHFRLTHFEAEQYVSTSGPAWQAYVIGRAV